MARRHRYRNPWPGQVEHGPTAVVRWIFESRKAAGSQGPDARFPTTTPAFERPRAQPGTLTATWVGHATTLLQLGPLNVLTDPMWSERASPSQLIGPRRRTPAAFPLDELPPIDLVLISHDHYDHLDRRTIGRLLRHSPDVRWAAPVGVGRYLRKFGASAVGEHGWWDRETASDLGLSVICTPARHFSGRAPWNRNRTLWCGWILQAHGLSVFFAGDTALHPEFGEIARRFGPFDLSLIPIGAYQPQWMMQPVHMDPDEAVQAYGDLATVHRERGWSPPAMLPIHWGTFKLSDEPLDEPPRRVASAWTAAGHDAQSLWLLQHGETRTR